LSNISFNPSIGEAINCLSLYKDHVPENGYISACLNLAISALETIQDGNYKLESDLITEKIAEIANFECPPIDCAHCKYCTDDFDCLSVICGHIMQIEEVKKWIRKNYSQT